MAAVSLGLILLFALTGDKPVEGFICLIPYSILLFAIYHLCRVRSYHTLWWALVALIAVIAYFNILYLPSYHDPAHFQ